jgi:hypothetical protein
VCVEVAAGLAPLLNVPENEEKWRSSKAMHLRLRTACCVHDLPAVKTAELLLSKICIYENAYALAVHHMRAVCTDTTQQDAWATRYAQSHYPVGSFINYYAAGQSHGMVAHIDYAASTTTKTNKVLFAVGII